MFMLVLRVLSTLLGTAGHKSYSVSHFWLEIWNVENVDYFRTWSSTYLSRVTGHTLHLVTLPRSTENDNSRLWGTVVLPRKCDRSSSFHVRFHETPVFVMAVLCPKVRALNDVFCRFAEIIPGLKNSTCILAISTFVAFAVQYRVTYGTNATFFLRYPWAHLWYS